MPVKQPYWLTPPPEYIRQLGEVRDELLRSIYDATEDISSRLAADVRRAIDRIERSGYKLRVVRQEVRQIGARHERRLGQVVGEQIEFASMMGGRYHEITTEGALVLKRNIKNIVATESLVARSATKRTIMAGDEKLKSLVKKPISLSRQLSRRLHGRQIRENKRIFREIRAAIRESHSMSRATNDLIRVAKMGQYEKMPGYLERLKKAGDALSRRGGPAELEVWRIELRKARKYAHRLAEDGRMKPTLLEALNKMEKAGPKKINKAFDYLAREKQRYNAERILRTEQQLAFKGSMIASDLENDAIIGYIWVMNRAARSGFAKRKRPHKSKKWGGRHRCICEILNGTRISKEAAAERPLGHPNCMCSLIPIYKHDNLTI